MTFHKAWGVLSLLIVLAAFIVSFSTGFSNAGILVGIVAVMSGFLLMNIKEK